MLKYIYSVFVLSIFSFQICALEEDFENFFDLSSDFDPWGLNYLKTNSEDVLAEPVEQNNNTLPPPLYYNAQYFAGYNAYCVMGASPIFIFNGPSTVYNYYCPAPNNFIPVLPPTLNTFSPEAPRASKRPGENLVAPAFKRAKIEEPVAKIKKVAQDKNDKMPVLKAFLTAIEKVKGGYYIDQEEGIIYIENLEIVLKYVEKICKKTRVTNLKENRIKTLTKWMEGFPRGKKKLSTSYTLNLIKSKKEDYKKLFSDE